MGIGGLQMFMGRFYLFGPVYLAVPELETRQVQPFSYRTLIPLRIYWAAGIL